MPVKSLLPIDMLRPGEWGCVADVAGDPGLVCRMAELGLQAGCQVQLLQGGTPCLLRVADCKLCLRADESAQILVQPMDEPAGRI